MIPQQNKLSRHFFRQVSLWNLNIEKCVWAQRKVQFLGTYVLSKSTVHPDPDKVQAIIQMPSPKTQKELKRFMGMLGYVRKFVPDYINLADIFRPLLKSKNQWFWENAQETAMTNIRTRLASAAVLGIHWRLQNRSYSPIALERHTCWMAYQ
jgi:hypothetical protein